MVMDSVGEYTGNLSRQLDTWVSGFDRLSCTEEDLPALEALISRFVESSAAIKAKVESVKTGVEADAWKRSEDLRTRAETTISTILEDGDSKISPVFKRNLLLIFHGPDFSDLDSDEMTYRKKGTQVRCERLRNLSSNGILSWALSFPPSTWSAGIMANDIFNCLIDDIEPHNNITWPPAIRTKLQEFWKHKVLQSSPEYARFVESVTNPSNITDDEIEEAQAPSQAPGTQNREMKQMFTNGPATGIAKMPQPFKRYVRNSKLWNWERSQNYQTTACVAVLFPRDVAQDVSVTIWCSANDGYRLNEFLELTEALSS